RSSKGRRRAAKARTVNPSELLHIGLPNDTVKRFVSLKYKMELQADKDTIYCPRSWCSGAARSRKRRKPKGPLERANESDESGESDDSDGEAVSNNNNNDKAGSAVQDAADLLAICEDCNFAFCRQCSQSWHGPLADCRPSKMQAEIDAQEQATQD